MRRLAPFLALVLLAACSGQDSAQQAPAREDSAARSAAASQVLTEIPAAFLGYWDYVEGRCAIWSDAQLTIEPRRLQFYESTGDVTAVRQPDAATIVVTMAMSGEGDTWTEESTYRLLEGGQVLESSFTGPDAGEPFRRKRCEALADVPME